MAPMWDRIDPLAEKYYGISPYAYCGGDPVNRGDYDGRLIEFADGVSQEFKDKFTALVDYMNTKGTSGDLKILQESKNTYYINESDSPIHNNFSAIKGKYTICINLDKGYQTNIGIFVSPATTAAHEFGHAASFEKDSKLPIEQRVDRTPGSDPEYGTKEERRNITITEQEAARKHGEIREDQVTRTSHNSKGPTVRVVSFKTNDFNKMSIQCGAVNMRKK